jgi:hypothetical protein
MHGDRYSPASATVNSVQIPLIAEHDGLPSGEIAGYRIHKASSASSLPKDRKQTALTKKKILRQCFTKVYFLSHLSFYLTYYL